MEKNVLQSIAGIGIYPAISFLIFFLFFLGLLLYVVRANRQHLSNMSQLPLLSNEDLPIPLTHNVLC